MGPRDGGFTCRLALFKFRSTMNDTWVATPDPNSLLSTLAATFRTGAAAAWPELGGLVSNCAAPAAASLEFSDKDGAASLLGEFLSAAVSARDSSAWALVAAAAAATAACPDGIATAVAEIGAAFACAASCGFTFASGVAKTTAADVEFVPGAAAFGASEAGVAPLTVTAAIACASAPVSVESGAPFAANVPGSEVARPIDADAAGTGAAFDAALSMLDTRTAGLAAARTAALLINGVDPVSAALAPFEASLAFAAPAALVRTPAERFGAEFMLMAATEVFKPATASEGAASEGVAAPCAMSVGACGVRIPPLFDGTAASPAATSAAAGCAVTPADPTGAVTDPAPDGRSEMGGAAAVAVAAGIGAAAAVAAGACATAADPAARDPAAGAPAADGGGGKGIGEDLPATGRWPPLGSTAAGMCAVVLRLGFAPASFNALAKSWL